MSDYTPRDGTVPHKVIEFLKTQAAGTTISAAEIGERFEVRGGASTLMRKAAEAGLLVATRAGRAMEYSLPPEAEPTDGPLTIANWSDGDVMVRGGAASEDGSVVYTREQMAQLVKHVTSPHIAPA